MLQLFKATVKATAGRSLVTPIIANASSAKFAEFDYTDALNFKSLLTEDEMMVRFIHNTCW